MRKAAVAFGVTPETKPDIEAAYHDTMAELDAHFSAHPYLLGGAPTIGDYGLFAALYPHWARPVSTSPNAEKSANVAALDRANA